MKIIKSEEFDSYWDSRTAYNNDEKTENAVKEIISAVQKDGDKGIYEYASLFDKSSPKRLEVPVCEIVNACENLRSKEPELTKALEFAAQNIFRFSTKQREQFCDFEFEMDKGLFTGQRIIPVCRAAIYVPGGRFPLFSSVLMGLIPAFCSGVEEVCFSSPPDEYGLPDKKILAAAAIAAQIAGIELNTGASKSRFRVFAIGGAQAIAAFAFGTQSVPRVDVIAGPGNRFVSTAKRLLYGQVGIDFIAGPSDVLVIAHNGGGNNAGTAGLIAADMIAQAEHDPDARARALVPSALLADMVGDAIEKRLASLSTAVTARSSLDEGGLIIIYKNREDAIRIANKIAPEHLELQTEENDKWIPYLKNYGSLFIGVLAAEALGDYSSGINHTLPTSGSSRFTSGLSVRHFLKTVTTLRCANGIGFDKACNAAEIIAKAEGLEGHALSAAARRLS